MFCSVHLTTCSNFHTDHSWFITHRIRTRHDVFEHFSPVVFLFEFRRCRWWIPCFPAFPQNTVTISCFPAFPQKTVTISHFPAFPHKSVSISCFPALPQNNSSISCFPAFPHNTVSISCFPTLPQNNTSILTYYLPSAIPSHLTRSLICYTRFRNFKHLESFRIADALGTGVWKWR